MSKTMNEAADREDGSARIVDVKVDLQLKALLDGMDAHLEDLRAGVERAQLEIERKRTLCAALPRSLPLAPTSVRASGQVYKADAEMTFSVASRDEAMALMDVLPGVPVVMVQAGCTTFIPQQRFVEDGRGGKMSPIGDTVYRISTWCGSLQEEYTWWTRLADRLVYVKAVTAKEGRPHAKAVGHSRDIGPTLVETTWVYSELPRGAVMQWFGGDGSSVAPLSVHQPRGVSFRDAAAATQGFIAKVKKDRCAC